MANAARAIALPAGISNEKPQYYDLAKLVHAGVSSWSFKDYFASTRPSDFDKPGPLINLLDFPESIADRYQIHRIEAAAVHFASRDSSYLTDLRRRIERAHSHLVCIDLTHETSGATPGGLASREPSAREAAISAAKEWIDAARILGASAVSTAPGALNPADLSPAVDAYRELSAYGRRRRIQVLIQNEIGIDPGIIVDIIREVGGWGIGALPDFARFRDASARDAGLEILLPRAPVLCHASGVAFDAMGNETAFDFRSCITLAKRYRFRGTYSVEYDGAGDPYQGVQDVLNELIRSL